MSFPGAGLGKPHELLLETRAVLCRLKYGGSPAVVSKSAVTLTRKTGITSMRSQSGDSGADSTRRLCVPRTRYAVPLSECPSSSPPVSWAALASRVSMTSVRHLEALRVPAVVEYGGRRHFGSFEPRVRNKKSSHTSEWIKRQITDRYVLKAQECNFRSRAAFKLEQLDDAYLFFRKNQIVVDLGAYPGGWSQVALDRIRAGGGQGKVIAVDPVAMDPLPNHTFIQGSVGQASTLHALLEELGERKADVVLSDMAPACIGVKQDDHLNSAELCLHASDLMEQILKLGGVFVTKMFMGSETNNFKVYLRSRFKKVSSAKPRYDTTSRLSSLSQKSRACRPESREMYFVCQGFVGRERISEEVQVKGAFSAKEGYL
ncbi:ribosomal rna large subunit methyltransferase [Cystoisospora suis]|uniref:rRNA methyltransferase 2, mitochondrial n=1 Tax=Cystoisospora suis TaxID=483139 RepID=A0A2C6LGM5_9APIC|nr:ribosomal rna large subunit methyltransferase [Cystoisospora suis]